MYAISFIFIGVVRIHNTKPKIEVVTYSFLLIIHIHVKKSITVLTSCYF